MNDRLESLKYTFTVEGETEYRYFLWLRDQINNHKVKQYSAVFDVKIQKSPRKFYKTANSKTVSKVSHICDVESNEAYHENDFKRTLDEMKAAKKDKGILYNLGYSNYTFELWMILHKMDCNSVLADRKQYLSYINQAYSETFRSLDDFKSEKDYARCLSKLKLKDVAKAVERAEKITMNNYNNRNTIIQYKGYSYFKENPSLSVHEVVNGILKDCKIFF